MGIVSGAILIISGVYLALGLVYLRFWWDERTRLAYLAFTISCLSYAIYAWFELGMIKASTPEEYLSYAWWAFVVGGVGITSFAWFGYLHLQGRKWIFFTYAAMRGLALLLHLIMANGINFRQITSVGQRTILGETLSYPVPVPNPWMVIPHLSHVVLIILFLDASVRCWRRGELRTALIFGMGTTLFGTATLIVPTSVLWGLASLPLFSSFYILFIVIPMLYELNYDMHRAAMADAKAVKLGGRLTEIVASVPGIVWESRTEPGAKARKTTFISGYVQKLLGYTPEEWMREQPGLQVVPEEDRERVARESDEVIKSGEEAVSEFRWITKDGRIRWVENHLSPIVDQEAGIVGLRGVALDVTDRRTAQQALRESESFNRAILSSLNAHVCVLDQEGRIISVNHAWTAFALENGLASAASVGPGVSYLDVCRKAIEGAELAQVAMDGVKGVCDGTREYFQLEYPCDSPTEKRWFLMIVTPLKGDTGGAVVVHNDITQLKLAQEAVDELSGRLMNAQEKERARLARELHDDLSQSIALLAIQLGMLQTDAKDIRLKDQLGQLVSDTQRLSKDVHRISHELHPSKLADLGLETALRSFCSEFSTAHRLQVDLVADEVPRDLSQEISLCLYRITQESLQNVAKHSGATKAQVNLGLKNGEVRLSVFDNGRGFDPASAKAKGGLGLVSIGERLQRVNGKVEIISAVGEGAKIEVSIPIVQRGLQP